MTETGVSERTADPGSPSRRVVVVGDALIDEIHRDGGVEEFVGGAALNVAVGLSTLGVRATLIAMIGDDEDGATIRRFLAAHDVELVPTIGPNGSSRGVSNRVNGEPVYVFNAAAQARRIQFGAPERAALSEASLVVVSCFPFDDVAQSDDLMAAVEDPSTRLVIDPNPRAGMTHDMELFRETFDRIAPQTLLIKVGSDDATLVYNETVAELSARLLADGAPVVLSTAGRDGASLATATGITASAPVADLPGPIIDTMGAGDATLAAVIHSILTNGFPTDGAGWQLVLQRAMLIAAATCRHEGALLQVP